MNAEDLKTEAIAWLRYIRRCHLVCTEVGPYNADCWGLSDGRLVEVETKISIADLKADFRKGKHARYALDQQKYYGVPNTFYFCVPAELQTKALELLDKLEPLCYVKPGPVAAVVKKYGLLVYEEASVLGRHLTVVKKAGFIHKNAPSAGTVRVAEMRMASELCGLRAALRDHVYRIGEQLRDLTKQTAEAYRQACLADRPLLEEEDESIGPQ